MTALSPVRTLPHDVSSRAASVQTASVLYYETHIAATEPDFGVIQSRFYNYYIYHRG